MQQLNGKEVAEDTFIQKGFVSFKGQERIQTVSYQKNPPKQQLNPALRTSDLACSGQLTMVSIFTYCPPPLPL